MAEERLSKEASCSSRAGKNDHAFKNHPKWHSLSSPVFQ